MATWNSENDDDEFFGSSAEEETTGRICTDGFEAHCGLVQAESSALEERHKVIGYHETYDAAKDSALQTGFDAGYSDHFDSSQRIGVVMGRLVMNSKLMNETKVQNRNDTKFRESMHIQALLLTKEHLTADTPQGNKQHSGSTGSYETNSLHDLEMKLLNLISNLDGA